MGLVKCATSTEQECFASHEDGGQANISPHPPSRERIPLYQADAMACMHLQITSGVMAGGGEVEVPERHPPARQEDTHHSVTEWSKWPDEEEGAGTAAMDEIELGKEGDAGSITSTRAARFPESQAKQASSDKPPGSLSKVQSAFGFSAKAESFEWDIHEYTVRLKGDKHGATRTIFRNIRGRATSGSFTGIMGPSGSGKTSLLDCLALRNPSFSGGLRLDDRPLQSSFFAHTGYVHQQEVFLNHLTCREHLLFHSINRMSYKYSTRQCSMRVDEVLEEVDLTRVANSQIGGGAFYITKGLSGGERKRLNIATELISDPSILFLDEPTSGLDAVMGELVCVLLQQLACCTPQRIIMTAIHTPSSKMFPMFTHLLILTSHGELAYHGPRAQMLPFLEGLGFRCPSNYNPADFVLELASAKVVKTNHPMDHGVAEEGKDMEGLSSVSTITTAEGGLGGGGGAGSGSMCDKVEAVLVSSEAHLRLVEACAHDLLGSYRRLGDSGDGQHQAMLSVAGGRSTFLTQFRMNLWRSWLQQSREVMAHTVGLIMNLALGFLFGILYLNRVQGSWRNEAGLLFALVVTLLISAAIQVTLHMPGDFMLLLREYYTSSNSSAPYFLGRTLGAMPFSIVYMATPIIAYWMTGLARDAAAFGWYCLICALIIFGAQSIGYLSSSFSSNPVVGLALMPVLITPMILFSGMLYERQSVPNYLRWIQDISLVNYGYATLIINEARAAKNHKVAELLLTFLQVHPRDWSKYLLLLFVLGMGYRLVALIVLVIRIRNVKPV